MKIFRFVINMTVQIWFMNMSFSRWDFNCGYKKSNISNMWHINLKLWTYSVEFYSLNIFCTLGFMTNADRLEVDIIEHEAGAHSLRVERKTRECLGDYKVLCLLCCTPNILVQFPWHTENKFGIIRCRAHRVACAKQGSRV